MKKQFKESEYPVYEIVVNEEDLSGIRLVSLVDEPAIELKGIAFSKDEKKEFQFKAEKDKQIIVGPALIPNKKILRKDEEGNLYYNVFKPETIQKLVEKFNKNGDNRRINIDHSNKMVKAFIKESWIVEDSYYDKSKIYGFNVPVGTWMIAVKVEDTNFWNEEVKDKGKYGFSIEGLLAEKPMEFWQLKSIDDFIDEMSDEELLELLEYKIEKKSGESKSEFMSRCISTEMDSGKPQDQAVAICLAYWEGEEEMAFAESYTDYPDGVKSNAKKVLEWTEKNGWGGCGTAVGKKRANQLAGGEPISLDTIKRMYSYLSRHEVDLEKSTSYNDGCGKLMYDSWGGKAALGWSRNKLRELGELDENEKEFKVISGNTRTRNNIIKSSNLWKFKYDDKKLELTLRFQNGDTYTYFDVPADIVDSIRDGDGVCDTEGENKWGKWFIGKTPSVGAAIHEILIGGGFQYTKGGNV